MPEPWATRLVQEGGGKVLVDERTLWPGGQFVTTHLIVSTSFLKAHPDVVERLVAGHIAATDYVNQNPAEAQDVVNAGIAKVTGQAMNVDVIKAAWPNMAFTFDPIASSLHKGAEDAKKVGLLAADTKLDGIYDLSFLNKLLTAAGKPPVPIGKQILPAEDAEGGPVPGAAFLAFGSFVRTCSRRWPGGAGRPGRPGRAGPGPSGPIGPCRRPHRRPRWSPGPGCCRCSRRASGCVT